MSISDISRALQDLQEIELSPCEKAVNGLNQTIGLALFIIGCVAAAGHMTGVVAGGCVVGLSIPLILTGIGQVVGGKQKGLALANVILSIFYTVMGSLAIAGVVTPVVAAWCVLVPTIISLSLACCVLCCGACAFGVIAASANR